LAVLALAGATLAFSGLTNGSFESGTYLDSGSGFEQLNAGDTSIDGWTVDSGSVDWIGTYWVAQDGSKSIDMSGTDAGAISQTFATTIGNTYTVSFFLSGNPAGPPTVKTLDVSATCKASLIARAPARAIDVTRFESYDADAVGVYLSRVPSGQTGAFEVVNYPDETMLYRYKDGGFVGTKISG